MCAIERSPSRSAIREANAHGIVVTNDYRSLPFDASAHGALALTSCGRFDRADHLLRHQPPASADACFEILTDLDVQMDITTQHMVFNCDTADVLFRYPERAEDDSPEMLML